MPEKMLEIVLVGKMDRMVLALLLRMPGMNGNSTGEVHWDSDELVTLASLDEDRKTLTVPTYSSVGDQLEFYVGMEFSNQAAFREYLVDYALKGGYNIRFIKSASWKFTVVCEGVCPWRVHASNMQREETF
ncbi:hypothetical protein FEM48_Zijuj02G0009100 [Ziziphus jujuba var. spinosa]|uniref:Transposase MuDR plant domain-containing protein n=1 Tax=Ziziphus jujuba var. spinosa TaxID=714518 RepID=A0A978VSN4_ZIZJJ|nr:hypothetical protein FEM48_Zijuj02G0009100 [Ziziphus jujuba var. spinosa]